MPGVLRTNTIQKINGSAPTLNDLSISHVGSIVQVVHANCTTHVTNTSASYIAAEISVAITPLFASSKILIISNVCLDIDASDVIAMKLKRDSTDIKEEHYWGYGTATDFIVSRNHHQYLDTPNTTSAITYSYDIKRVSGSASFHVNYDDGTGETDSQITAMEIKQ
tara:strand:- start:682 stop:1179 length:498 start_codon:yes stop_codon:yes gene_type:complete